MKSKVYFIAVGDSDKPELIKEKLKLLFCQSNILACINKDERVAVKLHFGEEGNVGFVKPEYVRIICEELNAKHASPFVCDTNTLYRGRRSNSVDHLSIAKEHGFSLESIMAPIVIPDDAQEKNISDVKINGKLIDIAKIAKVFKDADVLLGVAHFKGHMMTGFGGALKNIGMGCATREGKLAQHASVAPFVVAKNCVNCGACIKVCPVNVISVKSDKAHIDGSKCIGCASCIAACKYWAIDLDWEGGGKTLQEKMVEYTKAALLGKDNKKIFINFALKITKECDCLAQDDPKISPDVGIFASHDPVNIDKACMDLVNEACGKDVFKEAHPKRDGLVQLKYASEIGLGHLEYELVKCKYD